MKNKTVVTGYGIVSCLGGNKHEVLTALQQGVSGIAYDDSLTHCQSQYRGHARCSSKQIDSLQLGSKVKTMGMESLYAAVALREALLQSNLSLISPARVGLIVSNDSTAESNRQVADSMAKHDDTRYLGASSVFRALNSTVSMNIAQLYGPFDLSLTVSAACAGGGHAIGLAHSFIQSGYLDVAVVIGAQEDGPHAFDAFDALGVFARGDSGDAPTASRPFSHDRHGLVPSGGAACVILESSRHAKQRKAQPIASIDGYGFSTSDHLITPSPDYIYRSMVAALSDATFNDLGKLDLIAAHATGTPAGDLAEAKAIRMLLTHHNDHYYVSATKALSGHECWMAGVSQLVYTLLQMQHGFIAPYPHFQGQENSAPHLPISREGITDISIRHALLNAFGFGGTNSSLVVSLMP